jgi:hypothetical protein
MIILKLKVAASLKFGQRVVIDRISTHQYFSGLFVHVCEPWKSKWLPERYVDIYKNSQLHAGIM